MIHLGDITKIEGWEVEAPDIVVGGSPCQDLSIAGLRKGLAGERSGLFMEQIRLVKEIRDYDAIARPDVPLGDRKCRWMLWENVEGAFSSNSGRDFAAVIEETIRIAEPNAPDVPVPPEGWHKSGYIYDEMGRWSIAWRLHDLQFWGLPQRRKRIALLADFGGTEAGRIMFDPILWTAPSDTEAIEAFFTSRAGCRSEVLPIPQSLPGHSDQSQTERKGSPGDPAEGSGEAGCYTLKIRGGCEGGGKGALVQTEKSATLSTNQDQTLFQPVAFGICSYHSNSMLSDNPNSGIYQAETARTLDATSCGYPGCQQGGIAVVQVLNDQGGSVMDVSEDVVGTLRAEAHGHEPVVVENHPNDSRVSVKNDGVCQSLTSRMGTGGGNVPLVMQKPETLCLDVGFFNTITEQAPTELARQYKDPPCVLTQDYIVRRLTPRECERLQGFPDDWTLLESWTDANGKVHGNSDSARYKALGNSIGLPFWYWLLKRVSAVYDRPATMGSLFDGIGGFPLCWEAINGPGTALWASEIEDFPIAVTKKHFPEVTV